jgi:hypothetical protein
MVIINEKAEKSKKKNDFLSCFFEWWKMFFYCFLYTEKHERFKQDKQKRSDFTRFDKCNKFVTIVIIVSQTSEPLIYKGFREFLDVLHPIVARD